MALSFIENPENKEYVNHIDGNKLNNNINNLEWSTPSENNFHSVNSKLNNCIRDIIMVDLKTKEILKVFPSFHEAGRQTGIRYNDIHKACVRSGSTKGFIFDYLDNAYKYINKEELI